MRLLPAALLLLLLSAVAASARSAPCPRPVLGEVQVVENTLAFRVDAVYPVLCSKADTRILRDHVNAAIDAFKRTDPGRSLEVVPHPYEMLVRYETRSAAGGRLLSVRLHTMIYSGGAHPNNWPETWLFDLTDGRRLTLDDLFPAPVEALASLAPFVRDSLRRSLGEMCVETMLASGTEPAPANYAAFLLSDQGLTFCFPPYQVAPYAAGEQQILVPMARLLPLLRPETAALLR